MDARVDPLAVWVTHVASTGITTDSRSTLDRWLHPGIPWTLVIGGFVVLVLLSAVFTTMSWSGTRKNNDLRSVGRRSFH
jgi:hypothetical protein